MSPAKKCKFANARLLLKQDREGEECFISAILETGLTQSRLVLPSSAECDPFITEVLLALVSDRGLECGQSAQFGLRAKTQRALCNFLHVSL